jgi:hypothetical protein
MYSTEGGEGGGEVPGDLSGSGRWALLRLGVLTPIGLRSESTRLRSDAGEGERRLRLLRTAGDDEDEACWFSLVFSMSHGNTRGMLAVPLTPEGVQVRPDVRDLVRLDRVVLLTALSR